MNEIEEKLNELKRLDFDEEAFDEEKRLRFSAQNRFIDSLIEWYKIFENKDEATTHNCFWSYFFLIIQEFLIKSKYGEKHNDFEYSKESIRKMQETMPEYSCCMVGVHEDMKRLKSLLPIIYHELFFYLSYWACDAPYHGWDSSNDDVKMQLRLTDDLTHKFEEIYAIVLKALKETE